MYGEATSAPIIPLPEKIHGQNFANISAVADSLVCLSRTFESFAGPLLVLSSHWNSFAIWMARHIISHKTITAQWMAGHGVAWRKGEGAQNV